MRHVNENELRMSLLKVIGPYEGSAFMVGPNLALSCVHVCVPDGASPASRHKVELEYRPDPNAASVYLHGEYLPDQSDPDHDLAVIRVELPADLHIPPAPLSCEDRQRDKVVALGFPNGQPSRRRVPGVIDPIHYTDAVRFEPDGWTCPVLHIDTKGQEFWSDQVVRPGMSGGPIWNERTGTVVALVEGRKPRGYTPGDMPEGYGIPVKHLHSCSAEVRPLLQRSRIHQHFQGDAPATRFGLEAVLQRKGIVLEAQSRAQNALASNLEGQTLEVWQRLTQQRNTLARLLLRGPATQNLPDYRRAIAELSAAIAREEEFLAQRSGLLAQELVPRQVTAPIIAERLPSNGTLVEFVRIRHLHELAGH